MPKYDYICKDCATKAAQSSESEDFIYNESVFETYHSMNPSDDELLSAIKCPRCGGVNCDKSYFGYNITTFILGYGWSDVSGRKRDMHLYKLENEDPYSSFRQPGEADDLKTKLRNAGKHDPKTKYFTGKGNVDS